MDTRLVEGYIFLFEVLDMVGKECQHVLLAVIGLLAQRLVGDVYKRQLQDNQVTAHLRARVVREQVVGQAYRGYQIGLTEQLVTHCLLYTSRCV